MPQKNTVKKGKSIKTPLTFGKNQVRNCCKFLEAKTGRDVKNWIEKAYL